MGGTQSSPSNPSLTPPLVPKTAAGSVEYEDSQHKRRPPIVRQNINTSNLSARETATLIHMFHKLHSTADIRLKPDACVMVPNFKQAPFFTRVVSICGIAPQEITLSTLRRFCQPIGISSRSTDRKQELLERLVEWKELHEEEYRGPVPIVAPQSKKRTSESLQSSKNARASPLRPREITTITTSESSDTMKPSPLKRKWTDDDSDKYNNGPKKSGRPKKMVSNQIVPDQSLPNQILDEVVDIMDRTIRKLEEKRSFLESSNMVNS